MNNIIATGATKNSLMIWLALWLLAFILTGLFVYMGHMAWAQILLMHSICLWGIVSHERAGQLVQSFEVRNRLAGVFRLVFAGSLVVVIVNTVKIWI